MKCFEIEQSGDNCVGDHCVNPSVLGIPSKGNEMLRGSLSLMSRYLEVLEKLF